MRPVVERKALLPVTSAFLLAGLALPAAGCLFDHGSEGKTELPATPAAILGIPAEAAAEPEPKLVPGDADEAADAEAGNNPVEAVAEVAEELGAELGSFEITYYWMTQSRDGEGEPDTVLYDLSCQEIAVVTSQFAKRLAMEGTGRLRNGRVINVAGVCDCASVCYYLPRKHKRWGVGVAKRALSPFRSVAVDPDHVSIGQTLYIPELDGLTMPGRKPWGGFVHDGCVVADDRGGNVRGQQIDFFTGRRSAYSALFRRHRLSKVTVFDGTGRCTDEGGTVVARSASPS
jgi:3D (Asp-Asp-Asp) domain-containing protein